jgi:hypothetical protein
VADKDATISSVLKHPLPGALARPRAQRQQLRLQALLYANHKAGVQMLHAYSMSPSV